LHNSISCSARPFANSFANLTAPTDKKANQAVKLANELANGLAAHEIELCKENALYLQYKARKLEEA